MGKVAFVEPKIDLDLAEKIAFECDRYAIIWRWRIHRDIWHLETAKFEGTDEISPITFGGKERAIEYANKRYAGVKDVDCAIVCVKFAIELCENRNGVPYVVRTNKLRLTPFNRATRDFFKKRIGAKR